MELKWTAEPLLRSYFSGLSWAIEELYFIFSISSVFFIQLSMHTFKNVLRHVFQVSLGFWILLLFLFGINLNS